MAIHEVQGIGHVSPHSGRRVITEGVVTGIERRGFYMQDPGGSGGMRASNGIFVFTKDRPEVQCGDRVRVEGTVEEFRRNEVDLSSTQIARRPRVTILESNIELPAAVVLGSPAYPLPTGSLYEAGLAYERLEGMRVQLPPSQVIGALNRHGDMYVAPQSSHSEIEISEDGILRGRPDRDALARIKLSFDQQLYGGPGPALDVGDRIEAVEGIFFHAYGFYGIKPTARLVALRSGRKPTVTSLVGSETAITVATYNVENLDPHVESPEHLADGGRPDDDQGSGKLTALAEQVVTNLRSPDIIAVQEIQDSDGAEDTGNTDASKTWTALIEAIVASGGPRYEWVDRAPVDGADGGQPGANIRVGYLYNPARTRLVKESVQRVGDGDPAFVDGRKSLAAAFEFLPTGKTLHTVANHWASKRGSTPTYRNPNLPEVVGNADERLAQQKVIEAYINAIVAREPDARILSLGDFNAPEYSPELKAHGSGALFNLGDTTPDERRFSYIREGLAEAIDHQFLSRVLEGRAELEYIHVNSVFAIKASDHDPTVSRIDMN